MNPAIASSFDPWALPPLPWRFCIEVSRIAIHGKGSLRLLHGQTSQALLDLAPGEQRATCFVNATAWLAALAEVTASEAGAELLVTAGAGAEVYRALDRVIFPADQVQLQALEVLLWHGLVEEQGPENGAGWGLAGRHWLLSAEAPLPAELQQVQPLGADLQELLRYRQGIPAAPGELNAGINPFELGLDGRVSLDKGCYLGQETLAKLHSRAGVKQQLRRCYAPPGVLLPQAGAALLGPNGERAGSITSCQVGPQGTWGLALLRRDWFECENLAGVQFSLPAAASFSSH